MNSERHIYLQKKKKKRGKIGNFIFHQIWKIIFNKEIHLLWTQYNDMTSLKCFSYHTAEDCSQSLSQIRN